VLQLKALRDVRHTPSPHGFCKTLRWQELEGGGRQKNCRIRIYGMGTSEEGTENGRRGSKRLAERQVGEDGVWQTRGRIA